MFSATFRPLRQLWLRLTRPHRMRQLWQQVPARRVLAVRILPGAPGGGKADAEAWNNLSPEEKSKFYVLTVQYRNSDRVGDVRIVEEPYTY